jgi:glycosyltransferase involved in cell wall biosynthesis
MAFSVYKIAFEFAKAKRSRFVNPAVNLITQMAFGTRRPNPLETLLSRLIATAPGKNGAVRSAFLELLLELRELEHDDIDGKLEVLYCKVGSLADNLLGDFLARASAAVSQGDVEGVVRDTTAILPAVFLSVPFMSAFSNMYNNRSLVDDLSAGLGRRSSGSGKRILWFTDTLTDLNGVSYSLLEIGNLALRMGKDLTIAAAVGAHEEQDVPANVMRLPVVFSFDLPGYEHIRMRVPSLLKTLRLVHEYDPDEVFISSPGTVGLLGLAIAKMLRVKCTGVYHTDFAAQAQQVVDDVATARFLDGYMRWFFAACDETLVNTREYVSILMDRGYPADRLRIFDRGIDVDLFSPVAGAKEQVRRRFSVPPETLILYAGRISKDKDVGLLLRAFDAICAELPRVHLALAGDGPDLAEIRRQWGTHDRVHLLGRVSHSDMPTLFSAADLFAFPSTTDTFGRVVIEAQACGTPVLVSAVGGPQELIVPERTGFVVPDQTEISWSQALRRLVLVLESDVAGSHERSEEARRYVCEHFSLNRFVEGLFPEIGVRRD